jgi:hypothetical protein
MMQVIKERVVVNRMRRDRRIVIRRPIAIAESIVMTTGERMIRVVLLAGFVAVLAIEAWLLLRALQALL